MINHSGALWHYLGSFVLYTLGAIGLIYGIYWYARRTSGGLLSGAGKGNAQLPTLQVESTLPLDPRRTLYVIRSGSERFLISAAGDDTSLLSRLEPIQSEESLEAEIPVVMETERLEPWYASSPVVRSTPVPSAGLGARFVQSLQWLVASRMK